MNNTKVQIIPSHKIILPKESNPHDITREIKLWIRRCSSSATHMTLQGRYQLAPKAIPLMRLRAAYIKPMMINSMALKKSSNILNTTIESPWRHNSMALGIVNNEPMVKVHDETFHVTQQNELHVCKRLKEYGLTHGQQNYQPSIKMRRFKYLQE